MSKSNNQVIVNNDATSLRVGRDVYRKDYINGRMILPLKNLQRINADAACSAHGMSAVGLKWILTCHSHYTTKQIAELVEDTRKSENSNFKLRLSERGFVYVSRETYPMRTTRMFITAFVKYAKEVQELFEYFTNSDIDDSVRKPATNNEYDELRTELMYKHNIYTAIRGRKFIAHVGDIALKWGEHTNEQILDLLKVYGIKSVNTPSDDVIYRIIRHSRGYAKRNGFDAFVLLTNGITMPVGILYLIDTSDDIHVITNYNELSKED